MKINAPHIVAVDFDGTIVEHAYPEIGLSVPGAIETLKRLQNEGTKIILWTMRSNETLAEAVDYVTRRGINLWGINKNPQQVSWSSSPKAYAPLYIDDAAFGCPLIYPADGRRPFVNWGPIYQTFFEETLS